MIKLYTVDSESSSAQRLGFEMGTSIDGLSQDYRNDIIVRWGTSRKVYQNNNDRRAKVNYGDFPNVINSREAIRTNVNKLASLEIMSAVVKTPRIFKMSIPANTRAVVRSFEHSSGSGFEIVNGPAEINWREKFGTEFIECPKEYRCWFVGNKTLVGKRIPTTPEHNNQYPCRSKWGYTFIFDQFSQLREQTLRAAQAIGLEVGAADVLWDENRREYIFLELNSSPTVEGTVITDFYRNGIIELARRKFPNIPIDSNGRTIVTPRAIVAPRPVTPPPVVNTPVTSRYPRYSRVPNPVTPVVPARSTRVNIRSLFSNVR